MTETKRTKSKNTSLRWSVVFAQDLTTLCYVFVLSRYKLIYWDPVCEKLQQVLDDDILKRENLFYKYLKNALTFVINIGKPELCFQWDKKVPYFR